jgi:hypothetical protein
VGTRVDFEGDEVTVLNTHQLLQDEREAEGR